MILLPAAAISPVARALPVAGGDVIRQRLQDRTFFGARVGQLDQRRCVSGNARNASNVASASGASNRHRQYQGKSFPMCGVAVSSSMCVADQGEMGWDGERRYVQTATPARASPMILTTKSAPAVDSLATSRGVRPPSNRCGRLRNRTVAA